MWFLNNLMLAVAPNEADLASTTFWLHGLQSFGLSVVYSLLGLAMFALAYKVLGVILPFSIRKELEEDQNTSVGIVLGCMILGLSIIIAAAIN